MAKGRIVGIPHHSPALSTFTTVTLSRILCTSSRLSIFPIIYTFLPFSIVLFTLPYRLETLNNVIKSSQKFHIILRRSAPIPILHHNAQIFFFHFVPHLRFPPTRTQVHSLPFNNAGKEKKYFMMNLDFLVKFFGIWPVKV